MATHSTGGKLFHCFELSVITIQQVAPAQIRDIVFTRPAKRKPTHDGQCSSDSVDVRTPKKKVQSPTDEALDQLYEGWTGAESKPMLFKILRPYHKEFIPKLASEEFPRPISEMYNPATLSMNYTELLKESEKAFDKLKVCSSI